MKEATALPSCPPVLAALLARLPSYPPALALATGLNALLAPRLPADVGVLLQSRRLRLHVRDARVMLDFTWNGRRFAPLPRQQAPELTVSASGADFLRLARRQEDPDTLFFARRLSLEGDTELGLVVKNTLDALEWPVFDPATLFGRTRPRGRGPWN